MALPSLLTYSFFISEDVTDPKEVWRIIPIQFPTRSVS